MAIDFSRLFGDVIRRGYLFLIRSTLSVRHFTSIKPMVRLIFSDGVLARRISDWQVDSTDCVQRHSLSAVRAV